jgi:caffeoyl-CoA O-methyltransferase
MRYLAEFYLPGHGADLADLARRARATAERYGHAGPAVRFVSAIHAPGDESCFAIYDADFPAAVTVAGSLAGIVFDRVVEVATQDADAAGDEAGYPRRVARSSEQFSPELHAYLVAHSSPVDQVLASLAEQTLRLYPDAAGMQIGPEQGTFMTLLTRIGGARRGIEVGTFTGYSSICIARGLADGGRLTCCDVSEEWTSLARAYWDKAGLADRIELRLGPALGTLRALPAEAAFDIAFIDADKVGYIGYWDEIVPRMRPGGTVLVDNTFSHGRVIDEPNQDAVVQAIRDFNDHAVADDRVDLVMLPVGDGLTLARRK